MKTINDFKLINGIAVLEGVSYAEEAKVVEEYLKNNNNIEKASVIAKDGRFFELRNGKLVSSKDQTFLNPYYENIIKDNYRDIEDITVKTSENIIKNNVLSVHAIEQKLKSQEVKIDRLNSLIKEMLNLLNSYSK